MLCNPEGKKDGKALKDGRGIYVGESSRSLYERAKEHEADRQARSEDSHQIKHWLTEHQDLLAPPRFRFQVIQSFQDPLSRQLAEAVRIDLRGEAVLNSKSEYNKCRVPRLTINLKDWGLEEGGQNSKQTAGQDDLDKEMEDSLLERDKKRKGKEQKAARGSKKGNWTNW